VFTTDSLLQIGPDDPGTLIKLAKHQAAWHSLDEMPEDF